MDEPGGLVSVAQILAGLAGALRKLNDARAKISAAAEDTEQARTHTAAALEGVTSGRPMSAVTAYQMALTEAAESILPAIQHVEETVGQVYALGNHSGVAVARTVVHPPRSGRPHRTRAMLTFPVRANGGPRALARNRAHPRRDGAGRPSTPSNSRSARRWRPGAGAAFPSTCRPTPRHSSTSSWAGSWPGRLSRR
ncbi:DUF6244 family protein [Micromonospora yangpuensis]|uniref:DUF6244 family protein n=1 Tax=Micromonospora yangpuensis TaxID=683228 RepID=UPI0035A23219